MKIKYEINWWDLDDNEIFLLDEKISDFILNKIKTRYKNINKLRLKLGIGLELYHSLKYKKQGINSLHLKEILKNLDIKFSDLNNEIIGIGKFKSANFLFPVRLSPLWGCLLAHSFFDGYADQYIMRYSNYDSSNRKEFVTLVRKIFSNKLKFNNPENFRRDIDLPSIVPRLLCNFFDIDTFYSNKCRIPASLFKLTQENSEYGFYFLKGAYIDEGSISGGQIWVVSGIKNLELSKDIILLCDILGIKCRLKMSNKLLGSYSVGVKQESFDIFYENLEKLFWNKNKKLLRLEDLILKHRNPLKRDLQGRFIKREIYAR